MRVANMKTIATFTNQDQYVAGHVVYKNVICNVYMVPAWDDTTKAIKYAVQYEIIFDISHVECDQIVYNFNKKVKYKSINAISVPTGLSPDYVPRSGFQTCNLQSMVDEVVKG